MDDTRTSTTLATLASPWRNLAWSFHKSRENWKDKHQKLKQEHKRLQNQVRDVRKSRDHWREIAEQARLQAVESTAKIAELEAELAAARASEKKG